MAYSIEMPSLDARRDAVLDLWGRNFPEATEQRYDWLYERGPATGWLLHSELGDVVGAAGLMARSLCVAGQPIRAAQAIDLNVDRQHRTIGPALQLQRTVAATVTQGQFDLIYAFPNPDSELVHRRLGYKALGTFGRWAKPLRCEDSVKGWLRYPAVRKAASTVIDAALRLRSPETRYRRPAGLGVEISDRFDDRFDALFEEVAGRYGAIGHRGAAYLDWRFRRSPAARHRVLSLVDGRRRLLAYVVYSRRGGNVFLSDFLFREEEDLDRLLAELIRLARREKAGTIVTVHLGTEAVARTLARFGFLRRPSVWQTLVYFNPADSRLDAATLLDSGRWHLTRADVDTDF